MPYRASVFHPSGLPRPEPEKPAQFRCMELQGGTPVTRMPSLLLFRRAFETRENRLPGVRVPASPGKAACSLCTRRILSHCAQDVRPARAAPGFPLVPRITGRTDHSPSQTCLPCTRRLPPGHPASLPTARPAARDGTLACEQREMQRCICGPNSRCLACPGGARRAGHFRCMQPSGFVSGRVLFSGCFWRCT